MSSRTRWLIFAVSLLGLALAAGSSWVHYRLLTDPTYVSPCDVSATFNCTQVYLSRFGSVAGVPVALGGLIWFGLVALVSGFARPDEKPSVAAGYLFALSVIGLSVSLYLAYASFFVLRTGCLLCMGTYVCVLAIFGLTASTTMASLAGLPGRLMKDLGNLVSKPAPLAATVLYVVAMTATILFFPKEGALAAQAAAAPAPTGDAAAAFEQAWNQQPRVDLGIAPAGSKVIIVKFNDFECPACRQAEELYKPILEKFTKSHPGAVQYVVKDWPWNSSCNFNATQTIPGHEAACDAAVAARVARDQGKYDQMVTWLYANQGATSQVVRAEAAKLLGITDFDKEYAVRIADVKRDIADGGVLGINSTPSYFINGVRLPGGLIPPQYFELAINLELKKAGA